MDYDRPCGDGPSPDVSDSPWRPHGTSGNGILIWNAEHRKDLKSGSHSGYRGTPMGQVSKDATGFASNPQRRPVLSEPPTGPAMKFAVAVLVCLAAAVVAHADPEPHYFRSPYYYYPHYYYPRHHHLEPLKGDGVARHPGGGTSFVAPRVHGLKKRSADPMPEADPQPAADPEPVADPDPSKSYSYQVVHHGYPHYGYHHGYRYPYYGYRYSHHYGYPYTYHKHHKRSADPEPEAEPHYRYYGHPHYYKGYYHGYPYSYPYYAGYRYRYRG
nr:uncharacterized protein LOC113808866 [Penaeus vannamei]